MNDFKSHFQEQAPKKDRAAAGLDALTNVNPKWARKYTRLKGKIDQYLQAYNLVYQTLDTLEALSDDADLQQLFSEVENFVDTQDVNVRDTQGIEAQYGVPAPLIEFYVNAAVASEQIADYATSANLDMSNYDSGDEEGEY